MRLCYILLYIIIYYILFIIYYYILFIIYYYKIISETLLDRSLYVAFAIPRIYSLLILVHLSTSNSSSLGEDSINFLRPELVMFLQPRHTNSFNPQIYCKPLSVTFVLLKFNFSSFFKLPIIFMPLSLISVPIEQNNN